MRAKSQRDFLTALLFVTVGLLFVLDATVRPMGSAADMGPGYLPMWLGVALVVIGAVLGFKALTIERVGGDAVGPLAWRALAGVIGGVLGFAWLPAWIGLVPAVAVVALWSGGVGARLPWAVNLALALLLALVFWAAHAAGMLATLPLWWAG